MSYVISIFMLWNEVSPPKPLRVISFNFAGWFNKLNVFEFIMYIRSNIWIIVYTNTVNIVYITLIIHGVFNIQPKLTLISRIKDCHTWFYFAEL